MTHIDAFLLALWPRWRNRWIGWLRKMVSPRWLLASWWVGPFSSADNLLDNRVERITSWTLNPKKVPLAPKRLCFTIITHDINHALQICWHGMLSDVSGASFPCSSHALLTDNCFLADWTSIIKARQLSKAMSVNGVSTWQILRRLTRRKHILPTNWAIVLILVFEALMCFEDAHRNAHATFTAVAE